MSLNNVVLNGDKLVSTTSDGVAISEVITQDEGETDFESIRETRVAFLLADINNSSLSTEDTAVCSARINDGERIFVRKADKSIVETVATGSNTAGARLLPVMTSMENDLATVTYDSTDTNQYTTGEYGNSNTFDGNNGSFCFIGVNKSIGIILKNGVLKRATRFLLRCGYNYTSIYELANNFKIEGTLDGTNWATISIHNLSNFNGTEFGAELIGPGKVFDIQTPGDFIGYRLTVLSSTRNSRARIYTLDFLGEDGTSIDTTDVTNGEVPSGIYKFEEVVKINNNVAVEKDIVTEYGGNGTSLLAFPIYHDISLTGRELTAEIDFKTTGNTATEISGKIFKLV